ncbi:MAG: tetratricopeptide repeat protein [Candidatus Omnitrophica bacterium]|nr:tetratricopeptide repeat protein [Candidatus Omnitrophota bacterium]
MKNAFLAIILCLIGYTIYAQTLNTPFLFDDRSNIEINKNIRDIRDVKSIWNSHLGHPSRFIGFYSFALNYHFHQLNPYGYHLTNLLIHILNSFLAWWLAFQLLQFFERQLYDCVNMPARLQLKKLSSDKTYYDLIVSNKNILAYCTALIFLTHPGQIQAVTYLSQRFASLATLFYLLTLNSYLACRKQENFNIKSFAWAFLALLSALLGFFTKEITMTIPIMILFIEMYAVSRPSKHQTKTRNSFFIKFTLIAALLALLLIIPSHFKFKLHHVLFGHQESESTIGEIITFPKYLLSQPRVFLIYLKRLIIPGRYQFDYDFSLSQHFLETRTFLSFLLLMVMISMALLNQRKYRMITFGLWWILLAFSVNLVPRRNMVFEHKLYILNFGFALALCLGVIRIIRKKQLFVCLMLVITAGYSCLTFNRNQVYLSKLSFWQDAVSKAPQKARPQIFLGHSYYDQGKYRQATHHFTKAMEFNTDKYWHVFLSRIKSRCRASQFDACIEDCQQAFKQYPALNLLYRNQGYAYFMKGEYSSALSNLNKAIQFNPNNIENYLLRSEILIAMGKDERAKTDITTALNLDKDSAKAYALQAFIASKRNLDEESTLAFQHALNLDPNESSIYVYRSKALQKTKQYDKALIDISRAIAIHPDNVFLHLDQSKIFFALNQPENSLKAIKHAFNINPHIIEIYIHYGFVYQTLGQIDEAIYVITQAIELAPERAELYFHRMRFYWTKRDYYNAELDAYEAIERGYHISRTLLYELTERISEMQ